MLWNEDIKQMPKIVMLREKILLANMVKGRKLYLTEAKGKFMFLWSVRSKRINR